MCEAMEIIQARLRPADIHNMADVSLVRMFKTFTPTEDMQANNNKVSTSEDILVGDKDRLHTCLHVNHERQTTDKERDGQTNRGGETRESNRKHSCDKHCQ